MGLNEVYRGGADGQHRPHPHYGYDVNRSYQGGVAAHPDQSRPKGIEQRNEVDVAEIVTLSGGWFKDTDGTFYRQKDKKHQWRNSWIKPEPINHPELTTEEAYFIEIYRTRPTNSKQKRWVVGLRLPAELHMGMGAAGGRSPGDRLKGFLAVSYHDAECPTKVRFWYLLKRSGRAPAWEISSNMHVTVTRDNEEAPAEDHYKNHKLIKDREDLGAPIQELPIDHYRVEFFTALKNNRVVVVKGSTGCGKSTKLPLFILTESSDNKIIVTQPRRIGAKRLAEQVNKQVGGTQRSIAGYRVGGETYLTKAPIQFVTVDYLLVRMIHDPECINEYTHIVLDEMHERSPEAEFLFMLIRSLVSTKPNVKIILTSATLEDTFLSYFNPILNRPITELNPFPPVIDVLFKNKYEITEYFLDDMLNDKDCPLYGLLSKDKSHPFIDLMMRKAPTEAFPYMERSNLVALSDFCGRMALESVKVAGLILNELSKIIDRNSGYDHTCVLVFVPGAAELQDLDEEMRRSYMRNPGSHYEMLGDRPVRIFWMHSQFPDQMEGINDAPGPDEYRILIATNMAETGITIPNVSAVIDIGLEKTQIHESRLCMSQLILTMCSKASVTQRRGRTGRTCDGISIRLFSRDLHDKMKNFTPPGTAVQDTTKLALRASRIAPKFPSMPGFCGRRVRILNEEDNEERIMTVFYKDPIINKFVLVESEHMSGDTPPESFDFISDQELNNSTKCVLLDMKPVDLIELLPTKPGAVKIEQAFAELEQAGCTKDHKITVFGSYCLSLPLDIYTSRIVFFGNTGFECLYDAVMIAAASQFLSGSQTDLVKNPRPRRNEDMEMKDMRMMINGHRVRLETHFTNRGNNYLIESETIQMVRLFLDVLEENPTMSAKNAVGANWSKKLWCTQLVQKKKWMEFVEKAISIAECLPKLVPYESEESKVGIRDFLEMLRRQDSYASPQDRFPLNKFKIYKKPRHIVALIGFATCPRFLLYGGGKEDSREFLGGDSDTVALKGSPGDSGRLPTLDPKRTIRICIEFEDTRPNEATYGIKTLLKDTILAQVIKDVFWSELFFHSDLQQPRADYVFGTEEINYQMKRHFSDPSNIKGNLVQFPPMEGKEVGADHVSRLFARMSRIFMEVLLRLRHHQFNVRFVRKDFRYTVVQAKMERPNKINWEYVLPMQFDKSCTTDIDPRSIVYSMRSQPGGHKRWAVAAGAKAKKGYYADKVTMSGVTVLHDNNDLKWILCGRPFSSPLPSLVCCEDGSWKLAAVKFNEGYHTAQTPVDLSEVNNIRTILKEIFDRNYHQKAGQRVDINAEKRYIIEYIGDEFRLSNEDDMNEIVRHQESVHQGLEKCIGVEMTDMDMIHPELQDRLKEAIAKMLDVGLPETIPDDKLRCVNLRRTIGAFAVE